MSKATNLSIVDKNEALLQQKLDSGYPKVLHCVLRSQELKQGENVDETRGRKRTLAKTINQSDSICKLLKDISESTTKNTQLTFHSFHGQDDTNAASLFALNASAALGSSVSTARTPPIEPLPKRRRYQRRNSKVAHMLQGVFHQAVGEASSLPVITDSNSNAKPIEQRKRPRYQRRNSFLIRQEKGTLCLLDSALEVLGKPEDNQIELEPNRRHSWPEQRSKSAGKIHK